MKCKFKAKDLNKYFYKENAQMVNKHKNRYSTSSGKRKSELGWDSLSHMLGWLLLKKTKKIILVGEDV